MLLIVESVYHFCKLVAKMIHFATMTEAITAVLREHGYSVTKQRLLVFALLEGGKPLTMAELIELAHGALDRASLYRTVALFERCGITRRVSIGWKYKIELSDRFMEHHHHLTCLRCHAVIPISEDELEDFIHNVARRHDFEPLEHQVEVQGYCKACSGSR
jgi:Fe2+ or Zn2+ uptake regulation protein